MMKAMCSYVSSYVNLNLKHKSSEYFKVLCLKKGPNLPLEGMADGLVIGLFSCFVTM